MSNDNLNQQLGYAIHPGEILQDALDENHLTQKELASRIDVTPKHINEIIKGKASITSVLAQKLEFVFNTSSGFWLNLQKNYEEIMARLAIDDQFVREQSLLERFTCYKELAAFELVKRTNDKKERYVELLNFFAVSSLRLVERNYSVQFRKSAKEPNVDCMAAWLRIGEIEYRSLKPSKEFDEKLFRSKLEKIRTYTAEPIESATRKLRQDCFESGVAISFTPYLKNTYVNGATRWFPSGTPHIQLTARMKRSDILWFTFFHEAAHLLKHSKKRNYIEWEGNGTDDPDELEANEFAANILIPQGLYKSFVARGDFSVVAIKSFSGQISVGADIVAGRLGRDGHIEWPYVMRFARGIVIKP